MFIKLYKEGVVKPQSISVIEREYKSYIKPQIGNKEIQTVTEWDVKSIFDEMCEKGYATTTINNLHGHLASMFEKAGIKKIIKGNPMKEIGYSCNAKKNEKRELTDYELYWFFRGLEEKTK
ncbi:MAG: hypothetical protein J1F01_09465 [Oscillospiraceae bacterium]|nr:hypothetical protein [Oscillospiraceae bacterium]